MPQEVSGSVQWVPPAVQLEGAVPVRLPSLQAEAIPLWVPRTTFTSNRLATDTGVPMIIAGFHNPLEGLKDSSTRWKLLPSQLLQREDTGDQPKKKWVGQSLSLSSHRWYYRLLATACEDTHRVSPTRETDSVKPLVSSVSVRAQSHPALPVRLPFSLQPLTKVRLCSVICVSRGQSWCRMASEPQSYIRLLDRLSAGSLSSQANPDTPIRQDLPGA